MTISELIEKQDLERRRRVSFFLFQFNFFPYLKIYRPLNWGKVSIKITGEFAVSDPEHVAVMRF